MKTENILYDRLFGVHKYNSDVFLVLDNAKHVNYDEFITLATAFASVLENNGLIKGDRVLLKVDKSVQALAVYAACIQTGTVLVPLNTAYTKSELEYFISDAGPSLIVCDQSEEQVVKQILNYKEVAVLTLNNDATGSLIDEANKISIPADITPCDSDDLAALLYTSGTTGKSKGAMLTHSNLLSNTKSLVECWQFSKADVLLHALPIFHIHGLFVACNVALMSGCCVIFLPSFKLDLIVKALPAATTMMGVPTFYTRLLDDLRFDKQLVEHMRLFVSGSAPMLEDTHYTFEQRTGHRVLERYGMTETNMNTSNPYSDDRRIGTVGLPLDNVTVRINDADSGKELNVNEIGVIQVKGPNVFSGYWNMPEKTAEEFTNDGFFITGDLGFLDDQGYLTIIGREKDLIISGGYNVYPKEVESLLDAIEGIDESAVVGIADMDLGEKVVAIIVLENSSALTKSTIINAAKEKLASYKCPKLIYFLDELPRNTMGKVQKNILRDQFS